MANVSAGTLFSVKKAKIAEADMSGNLGVFTRECRGSFVCWDRFLGPEEEKENAGKKVGNEGEGGRKETEVECLQTQTRGEAGTTVLQVFCERPPNLKKNIFSTNWNRCILVCLGLLMVWV